MSASPESGFTFEAQTLPPPAGQSQRDTEKAIWGTAAAEQENRLCGCDMNKCVYIVNVSGVDKTKS